MTWTAALTSKSLKNGRYAFQVTFTDDVDQSTQVEEIIASTAQNFRQHVARRLAELNAKATEFDAVPIGPVAAPTTTPRDTAQENFIDDDLLLTALLRAAAKGLIAVDDVRIVNTRGRMVTALTNRPPLVRLVSAV